MKIIYEIQWLTYMLHDFDVSPKLTLVLCDNKCEIHIVENFVIKYIEMISCFF